MNLLQRLQLADWRLELFTAFTCVIFFFLYKFGDLYNTKKVSTFLQGVLGVFEENFHLFGVGNGKLFEKDSSENFASYASGRENISRVNLVFRLAPRQNFFIWVMELIFSFFTESVSTPEDKVDIVISPSADYENFISAIVSKLGMNEYRRLNYYLSLTKTSDSASLPESFVFMSEANDFQEKTFTERLAKSLNLSMASYLRYLAFTDQPIDRPQVIRDLIPQRRIVLSVKLVSGKQQLAEISEVLAAVFEIIDKISSGEITFRAESSKKVVKTRDAEVAKIIKAEEAMKQDDLAEEKARLKREEKERFRRMSREEQERAEKKANEKKQRKLQKKMKVRS
ncbi:DUF1682-domain-containing protein [Metschnikowia bicuspidata var. bicuspidata NRRL YB-4993]|uniref:DUF1682-domain-containing protein n=1 Tax=Metschnikowia bicuspidata var. bicuspidata NRRL YB-4993 TaxID=869754 RepID=A0A1A0H7S5_9ASCO|nr:DUF1682-domain-containing protein [Metschnikowia bicuspidata var. bicuspidata NRRL YB-4993]OBA20076.1 DUF1682-domain-containing protein [Metschnikowia bicuspidata var. bicuspidata NRRL YB-4993]